MKDIIDSIRMQIYERLSNPLFGAFIVSWTCWNYRFLFVLFSILPVTERFELIDHRIYTTWLEVLCHCVIGPVCTAILYVLLYPRVSKFFYKDWLQKQVEIKELRDEIEKATLLTREESQAIQMKILKVKEEYEEMIKSLTAENEALKKNSSSDEFKQLRNEVQLIEKRKNDSEKNEIADLVQQGVQILLLAQRSQSGLQGVELADVQSWVTRLGGIIRRIYGEKSQYFADYTKAVATNNFYNINSNWNAHIAQLVGVAKGISQVLEKERSAPAP
jgi:F0F1-type ATP synthase membrane subunit b/b'